MLAQGRPLYLVPVAAMLEHCWLEDPVPEAEMLAKDMPVKPVFDDAMSESGGRPEDKFLLQKCLYGEGKYNRFSKQPCSHVDSRKNRYCWRPFWHVAGRS